MSHTAVDWRQLSRYLWVGESADGHAGIIEHGRGYVAIDCRGEVQGRVKSLEMAMQLLAESADPRPQQERSA